jgi:hypothetical protein
MRTGYLRRGEGACGGEGQCHLLRSLKRSVACLIYNFLLRRFDYLEISGTRWCKQVSCIHRFSLSFIFLSTQRIGALLDSASTGLLLWSASRTRTWQTTNTMMMRDPTEASLLFVSRPNFVCKIIELVCVFLADMIECI